MGVDKVFLLDELAHDGEEWVKFLNEVFHYVVRITDSVVIVMPLGASTKQSIH